MKLSFSFLPTALSFLGGYNANLLEDHSYQLQTLDHLHMVSSPVQYDGREGIDVIGFTPEAKAATIYIANNDQEPMHDKRLSMADIYFALCNKEGLRPESMNWISFDVNDDPETDGIITHIHDTREISPMDEVVIVPGEREWDYIVRTEYYRKMQLIMSKTPRKVLLRNHAYKAKSGTVFFINCIFFSFSSSDDNPFITESGWPFDDENQRASISYE